MVQLDLFTNVLLEEENKKLTSMIVKILWYCNFLKETKATYSQKDISNYILHCILNKKDD